MEQLYQEIILDHYRTPHHAGLREPFDAELYQVNPTCGDEITLRVRLRGRHRRRRLLRDARLLDHPGVGVGAHRPRRRASPSSDSLTVLREFQEMAQGRGQVEPDEDVLGDGMAFAGVARYPARVKCALLGWMAFKDALVRSEEKA